MKKYTTMINFCFSIQKIGPQYPSVLTMLAFVFWTAPNFIILALKIEKL